LERKGKDEIIDHWTAGLYTPNWIELKDYHAAAIWIPEKEIVIARKFNNYDLILPHCWHDNEHTIGIAVCCMGGKGVGPMNFGKWPLRLEMIKELELLNAEIAFIKGIDSSRIKTHAEKAIEMDYFGERWDLARLTEGVLSKETAIEIGKQIRASSRSLKMEIISGERKVRPFHFESRIKGELVK
jgi:predicted GIY-YIG superfamily endonuclease